MKESIATAIMGVFVVLGYSTGNYGAGFIDSPSNLASYQSSVSVANYGAGFIAAPNLNANSVYMPYPNRNPHHVWYGYQSRLTFW